MSLKKVKHIAVAGNIGAGKTTLSGLLAKHYNWKVLYEDIDVNPYLEDFYGDMSRWSFNLQIYFLNSRFQQVNEIRGGETTVIQDRTIYEDAKIFAPNLYEIGHMEKRDFDSYISLFKLMSRFVMPPDLLIYLKADVSTLVEHIQTRGRDYEGKMNLDYLRKLNDKYNNWIDNYNDGNLMIIDIAGKDFLNNREHLGEVIEKIDAKLFGLFSDS
jgi:deoxyadenosine/deoxycytidine kinase